MFEKISTTLTNLFGDAGKWILVAILGVLVILCIVLVVFVALNIKWVLLGGSAAAVFTAIGFIVYKKIKETG